MPMLLPNPAIKVVRTQTVLARDEVHYVGQPVAVVIADSRYLAEDAAALLIVNYDLLDAVGNCRDAVKDGAARAHSDLDSNAIAKFASVYGDNDAAFADAAHVFDEVIWQHRGGGMALETRAVLASLDPVSDVLTVWSSTQTPHIGRGMPADLLEREIESIRMIAPDVGGALRRQGFIMSAFGGKAEITPTCADVCF
jgi:carbon-monoxide dehydrogenase large subunit